jgi:hypothetical protein
VPTSYGNINTSIMREDPQIEAYKIGLINAAKTLGGVPIDTSKFAPGVAGLSDLESSAIERFQGGLGAYQPYLDQAGTALGGIQSLVGGLQGGAQMYDPNMAQSFMNPYQRAVTDQALADIDREAGKSRQQLNARAIQAGAFGGGRADLMRSDFDRNIADIKSKRISEDLSKNYMQALAGSMGAFKDQQQRALEAGRTGIAGLGQLGTQYGQLGALTSGLALDDINAMMGLGGLQRDIDQRTMDAETAAARAAAYEPYSRLSFISDIYKGAPSTQTQLSLGMEPQTNPYAQGLGAMMGGYGAYRGLNSMFGGGTPVA